MRELSALSRVAQLDGYRRYCTDRDWYCTDRDWLESFGLDRRALLVNNEVLGTGVVRTYWVLSMPEDDNNINTLILDMNVQAFNHITNKENTNG